MTAKCSYKVRSKVWVYPGMAAWRFVNIDKARSAEIKTKHGTPSRGFGSIRVRATIGKAVWDTSIFPDKRSGTYLLPLKAKVRAAENIADDDVVAFTIAIRS